ncbi:hypothetical protein [Algoriphagus sp.]|uniref:hypothetical protein n=1 Tax=Algoriphagus sp. TaxID=1872435 RepID=UPI00327B6B0A
MSSSQFPYPLLLDIEGEFGEGNIRDKAITSISFVVKDGDIITFSGPISKNFDKIASDLSAEK